MAKQTEDQKNLDPNKEIVIVHDTKSGRIQAVGSIDEKTFKHSEVEPISANRKAFMEVKKTSVIRNFMSNLVSQAKEPYRFGFYIIPENKLPEVTDNLYKLNQNPKDRDTIKALAPYRTSGRQLDRIKFDKYEIPFESLSHATGLPREQIEKNIRPVMEGRTFPELLNVDIKTPDGLTMTGQYAFQMARDENGIAQTKMVAPLPRPEFESEQFKDLSQEEKAKMVAQQPIDRLLSEDKGNGMKDFYMPVYNLLTNRIDKVYPREINFDEWAFREKLSDTAIQEAKLGHKFEIRNGRYGQGGPEFSGKGQFDPYQMTYVASDLIYKELNIPKHLKDQLTPEDLAKMENREPIDGRKYTARNGENYRCDIRISPRTNTAEYGNFLGQDQKKAETQQQAQWPDNDTHKAQAKSQGKSM